MTDRLRCPCNGPLKPLVVRKGYPMKSVCLTCHRVGPLWSVVLGGPPEAEQRHREAMRLACHLEE